MAARPGCTLATDYDNVRTRKNNCVKEDSTNNPSCVFHLSISHGTSRNVQCCKPDVPVLPNYAKQFSAVVLVRKFRYLQIGAKTKINFWKYYTPAFDRISGLPRCVLQYGLGSEGGCGKVFFSPLSLRLFEGGSSGGARSKFDGTCRPSPAFSSFDI